MKIKHQNSQADQPNAEQIQDTIWWHMKFDEWVETTYETAQRDLDRARWELSRLTPDVLQHKQQVGIFDLNPTQPAGQRLIDFLNLSLLVARCEDTQRYWRVYYFDSQGDEKAVDWHDVFDVGEFYGRFLEWLDADEPMKTLWKQSGLVVEDLGGVE
jgi:hypothetical protein